MAPIVPDVVEKSDTFVRSLDRGLAVIRAFGPGNERLTLSEVAKETGLTRSAARRFLLTLVEIGYVRSDGREFSLRPRILELGYTYLSGMGITELARPHVEDLVATVEESATVGVLDDLDMVCILRVPARRVMVVALAVGTRMPTYATATGRVLLAGLSEDEFEAYLDRVRLAPLTGRTVHDRELLRSIVEQTRADGFARVDQELEDGLRSAAVPIRDANGHVMAGLAIPGHASMLTMDALRDELVPAMRATADQIEADLRAQGGTARQPEPIVPEGV